MGSQKPPEDKHVTQMIIPVSKETFFNTKWEQKKAPLCPYDMLYHPPDYNPKAARSDRTEPQIIRKNIWDQEYHKGIPSTTHFTHGRPKWKIVDRPTKQYVRVQAGSASGEMISSPQHCACPLRGGATEPSITGSNFCSGMALFMIVLESYIKGRCDIQSPCDTLYPEQELKLEYDFIVVGAGAAGSVVAGRLSEDGDNDVLLLEAGGMEPTGARIPSFYRAFWGNPEVDWAYRTVPADYCLDQEGKGCSWPRGKVVGGCNVLNGMMYHRGHRADFEDWVAAGAKGWDWQNVLPYFGLNEGNKQIGSVVSEKHHSANGTMPVQQWPYQPPFLFELMNAINETGMPIIADMNDPTTPEGFTIAQTMSQNGQRVTSARAYLKPRDNLSLKTHAHVSKVIFEGNRAVGVEFLDEDGQTKIVRARKEVILSAGALNTPHILLLSGIGPKDQLQNLSIPVIADLPVGQNLRNHVGLTLYFIITEMNNTNVLDWSVFMEYMLGRTGPMASTGITQLTGMMYSSLVDRAREQPDIQFFFNGFWAECSKTGVIGEPLGDGDCYLKGRNISANAALLLPRSVGYLTLNSTDPRDPPLFYPGYFTHPDDMVMAKDGAKILQRIFESDTMRNKYGVKLDPAYTSECSNACKEWSDEWIECMTRLHTDPQNHQMGTAAIGTVVDTELRVYGVEGLRVMDASVMPTQVTGNPQAPIMMVAERGAALLKEAWA